MAIQPPHVKKPGYQVVRTPAPDEVTRVRDPQGGDAYGQNSGAGNPSSLPPGKGGAQSLLGQNMRDSVDDPVMEQILGRSAPMCRSEGRTTFRPSCKRSATPAVPAMSATAPAPG